MAENSEANYGNGLPDVQLDVKEVFLEILELEFLTILKLLERLILVVPLEMILKMKSIKIFKIWNNLKIFLKPTSNVIAKPKIAVRPRPAKK